MDIFLVNSGPCDFFKPKQPLRNALYKNNRDGTFTDVTAKAGVAGASGTFGMGVAVGDFDNDGFPDLFVTAYGRPILYHNNGNGTFTDVTRKSRHRAADWPWTTSAVWFDYDNDGRLDLFMCCFVDYSTTTHFSCGDNKLGRTYYCIPAGLQAHRQPAVPQQRRRHVHRGERAPISPRRSARGSASLPPTSTTTAAWTCSSPTTPCRIFCSSTAVRAGDTMGGDGARRRGGLQR